MPNVERLLPRRLQLLALADVGRERDHFRLVVVLQPLEDHGGVEAAGIGEDDFADVAHGMRPEASVRRKAGGSGHRGTTDCGAGSCGSIDGVVTERLVEKLRIIGQPRQSRLSWCWRAWASLRCRFAR